MAFRVVEADHEIMSVGTFADGFLIHDAEIFAILEDLFAAFLGVDADHFHAVRWSFEVVLPDDFVVFEDLFVCFGSVEWEECIGRCASPCSWEPAKEYVWEHSTV